MQVNILEAKNRLSELIKCARAGEDVIIANRGQPSVRLVPVENSDGDIDEDGSAAALLNWLQARPVRPAMRSATQIENDINASRDAWD